MGSEMCIRDSPRERRLLQSLDAIQEFAQRLLELLESFVLAHDLNAIGAIPFASSTFGIRRLVRATRDGRQGEVGDSTTGSP